MTLSFRATPFWTTYVLLDDQQESGRFQRQLAVLCRDLVTRIGLAAKREAVPVTRHLADGISVICRIVAQPLVVIRGDIHLVICRQLVPDKTVDTAAI